MSRSGQEPPRTFFPTAINTYRQCPERYYHYYIRRRRRPQPFSRALAVGGATHRLIATVLPRYIQTGELPPDIEARAADELSTAAYPPDHEGDREEDVRNVVRWTLTALDSIPDGAIPILQERRLYSLLGRTGIEIGAQIDLVVEHTAGEIEHIDFKTGQVRDNTVQSIIGRAVVGRRFGTRRRIRTTTLYLQQPERRSAVLTRESSRADWRAIARDIREIRSLDRFPPSPGPLCDFCPYQARDCTVW